MIIPLFDIYGHAVIALLSLLLMIFILTKKIMILRLYLLWSSFVMLICRGTTVNILALVPWPDTREHANFDIGLELIPGGRMAAAEINNRSDILKGYRVNVIEAGHDACGVVEHTLGLLNLVHFGVNPLRDTNAVAVVGLYCSSSTIALSSIANRIDLVQLSASNSPVFNEDKDKFPHLWRFLESASVYASMMIHLMQEYDWSRIAIISNQESVFYDGIARTLVDQLWETKRIRPIYQGQLIKLVSKIESQVLENLVTAEARIVFIAAEDVQIASLLCKAFEQNMFYPNYLWIIADWTLDSLINSGGGCNEEILKKVLEQCILSGFSLTPLDKTEILDLSQYSYETFLRNYYEELEIVKQDYKDLIVETQTNVAGDPEYSSLLYDQ